MRKKIKRQIMSDELTVAIGLVWGHLSASQYEEAFYLARGCLRVWPDEKRLLLMAAFAAVELLEPLDEKMMEALKNAECRDWADMVLRRLDAGPKVGTDLANYV